MNKMKRYINAHVPVTTCNLRCPYCYITQNKRWNDKLPDFKYSPQIIGKALSKKRLGGPCHINICGGGETLLPSEIIGMIRSMLNQGHYVVVVTNGTLAKRFNEIIEFPENLLKRLGFKFSFHYQELKRTNKLELFFNNIEKVSEAGCSFSVEMTPHDEIISEIEEIKNICMKNLGALCHLTVARDDAQKNKPILTNHSREKYKKIWGGFGSDLFEFKLSTFNEKREEFCYAGDWTTVLNLGTGILKPCYKVKMTQNIFENIDKPIKFTAIGENCPEPHCYNSHAFMTLGVIPEIETPTYAAMRDRDVKEGDQKWLKPKMKDFLSCKLNESNNAYNKFEKKKVKLIRGKERFKYFINRVIRKLDRTFNN